ncbi:hypothetical protein V2W45_675410 [Cenococcum geophilum]
MEPIPFSGSRSRPNVANHPFQNTPGRLSRYALRPVLYLRKNGIFVEAFPVSSNFTTVSCSPSAAYDSSVRLVSSFESASTVPHSSSSLTTASHLFAAAQYSDVRPTLSLP